MMKYLLTLMVSLFLLFQSVGFCGYQEMIAYFEAEATSLDHQMALTALESFRTSPHHPAAYRAIDAHTEAISLELKRAEEAYRNCFLSEKEFQEDLSRNSAALTAATLTPDAIEAFRRDRFRLFREAYTQGTQDGLGALFNHIRYKVALETYISYLLRSRIAADVEHALRIIEIRGVCPETLPPPRKPFRADESHKSLGVSSTSGRSVGYFSDVPLGSLK